MVALVGFDMPEGTLADGLKAIGLPPDAEVAPAAGGASGSVWRVRAGDQAYALRFSASKRLTHGRLAAMRAARAGGLPVPQLVRRVSDARGEFVLLTWLEGTPMLEAILRQPDSAKDWARRMGQTQRRLHEIAAPRAVLAADAEGAHPFDAGRGVQGLPRGDALLHLDWHPGNVLVDEAAGKICGIVDWDNSRRGHPLLDLARTHAMLTVDPALAALPVDVRRLLAPFSDAWAAGYGAEASRIPERCHRWAGVVMLADLAPRYETSAELLAPLRRWTEGWG